METRGKFVRAMVAGLLLLSASGAIRLFGTGTSLVHFISGVAAGTGLVLTIWSFYHISRPMA